MDDRVVGEERRQRILDVLTHQGFASLSEVMELTRASEATARRDLVLLERQGDLVRTRGGAKAISRPTTLEERFEMRRRRDRREKRLIAKLAAERIPDGATLFLNDGSSTYALAQSLLNRRLTVITSGLNIAQYLSATPATQVIVIGGSLRGTSFGTDGPLAVAAVTELHADLAVLGVDGITLEGGARANGLENAAVARAMKDHAARTIVLASPSKVGRDARMRIASWAEVDELVGASLPADFREALGAHGVNLVLPAGPD